jgi:hypothetical protein
MEHLRRYSRRMIIVRCILVEITVPVRILPRMDTSPVKGHFLSENQMSAHVDQKVITFLGSVRGTWVLFCFEMQSGSNRPRFG